MTELGFMSLINKPTREKDGSKSCLDHYFVGPKLNENYKTFIAHTSISDHYSTILKVRKPSRTDENKVCEYLEISTLNAENLEKILETVTWEEIYEEINPEVSSAFLIDKLANLIKENTLSKTINIGKRKTPWVSSGLITSIKKRDNYTFNVRNNPLTLDSMISIENIEINSTHSSQNKQKITLKNK